MKFQHLVAASLLSLPLASLAESGTPATSVLNVSASVQASCTVSGSHLNFGNYDKAAGNNTSTVLNVECTTGTPYSVALGAGSHPGATAEARYMSSATTTTPLKYLLSHAAAGNKTWGDTAGVNTLSGNIGTGLQQAITVYASLPSNQIVAPGEYKDVVNVTVSMDNVN